MTNRDYFKNTLYFGFTDALDEGFTCIYVYQKTKHSKSINIITLCAKTGEEQKEIDKFYSEECIFSLNHPSWDDNDCFTISVSDFLNKKHIKKDRCLKYLYKEIDNLLSINISDDLNELKEAEIDIFSYWSFDKPKFDKIEIKAKNKVYNYKCIKVKNIYAFVTI